MNTEETVDKLIEKYNSRNPFDIARDMNTIVVFVSLVGVRGFYQYFQRNNLIYIDCNLNKHQQKFVCAHELGHMILHKKSNAIYMNTKTIFNTNKYEKEADKFAMYLLIPDETINDLKNYSLNQLSLILGYSEELIKIRMT